MKKNIVKFTEDLHESQLFLNVAISCHGKNNEQEEHKSFLIEKLKVNFSTKEIIIAIDEYFKDAKRSKDQIISILESHKNRNK